MYSNWVSNINKQIIVILPTWLLHGVFRISIYFRNFNQRRLSPVGFGYIYRDESETSAPKYFMGILLLWFSRGLSTCALLSEETGQLINRPGNAMARIHQFLMKSLGWYGQPHPQGFSPYLKRTIYRGVLGMIWYDRCKSRVLINVKKWRTISKNTFFSFLFLRC